jgi:MFS family permease
MVPAKGTATARLVLVAMTLANSMILVDQTAVPLTLPAIMQDFGVQSQAVQWVLNGSLLPLAGLLVFGGRLGDLLGRRRIFLLGLAVFAGASAVGGLAPSFPLLLLARVAQGAGGALMLPGSVALLSAAFPPGETGPCAGHHGWGGRRGRSSGTDDRRRARHRQLARGAAGQRAARGGVRLPDPARRRG